MEEAWARRNDPVRAPLAVSRVPRSGGRAPVAQATPGGAPIARGPRRVWSDREFEAQVCRWSHASKAWQFGGGGGISCPILSVLCFFFQGSSAIPGLS